jgi:hypothetical protein
MYNGHYNGKLEGNSMAASSTLENGAVKHWVMVRPEPAGQYTAQAVGLPDIAATASTKEEAIQAVHDILRGLMASGQLVPVEVEQKNPLLQWFGSADPNDSSEQAYLAELARFRQEDKESTLRELDQECSNSSSTPTT